MPPHDRLCSRSVSQCFTYTWGGSCQAFLVFRVLFFKILMNGFQRITKTETSKSFSWPVKKQNRGWLDASDFWPPCSNQTKLPLGPFGLRGRRLLYVPPTWTLASVRRNGPSAICVVITESRSPPPPHLRSHIPPIPPPGIQIVSTLVQVTGSPHSMSCRDINGV